ncbi:MAG: caspase family protein [Armatimonadota bacterium]|nr:MAG: caspase family protein [Armatimonadota bacterium]
MDSTLAHTPTEAADGPQHRLIAVLIGASNYSGDLCPLPYVATDVAALHTALLKTQPPDSLDLQVLASAGPVAADRPPTRSHILRALSRAAQIAKAEDTVFIYYAGHGMILNGSSVLVPEQTEPSASSEQRATVSVEEIMEAFVQSASRPRVLILDACQSWQEQPVTLSAEHGAGGSLGRTWGRTTHDFIRGLPLTSPDWVLLLSCAPGEEALEIDGHGLFSRLLAAGLRLDGDLDGDGTVHLGELVHYLATAVPAEASSFHSELRRPHLQHPVLVCRGQMDIPLTTRARGESEITLPDYQRRSLPRPGFLLRWARALAGAWPYGDFPARRLGPIGTGVLYATALAAAAAYFLQASGRQDITWIALLMGAATMLIWWLVVGLGVAASQDAWHAGGYVTGLALVAWHILAYVLLRALSPPAPPDAVTALGVLLCVDLALIIVLGTNAWQFVLSILVLLHLRERAIVARSLTELDERWVNARIPNVIAMVSVQPRLYFLLFGFLGTGILIWQIVAAYANAGQSADGQALLLHHAALLVLVWWSVCWYYAVYRFVKGQRRPDV